MGFHFQGNIGYVDSFGYLIIDDDFNKKQSYNQVIARIDGKNNQYNIDN